MDFILTMFECHVLHIVGSLDWYVLVVFGLKKKNKNKQLCNLSNKMQSRSIYS
jgi:hypothetical protein